MVGVSSRRGEAGEGFGWQPRYFFGVIQKTLIVRSDRKFGKNDRLTEAGDFSLVFREGKKQIEHPIVLRYRVRSRKDARPRLGLSVGRKVSLSACTRNWIKRIIRECFRDKSRAIPAMDLVVNVIPCSRGYLSKRIVRESVNKCLNRLQTGLTAD